VQPVALADLMPTLVELAGLAPPAPAVGASLTPLLRGEKQPSRPIFNESRGSPLMARDGRWWYVTFRGERAEELYDAATDPAQKHNLAGTAPSELTWMREVMAGLAMQAARGYRLAVKGPRDQALTLTLDSTPGFAYLDLPTRQKEQTVHVERTSSGAPKKGSPATQGQTVTIELPAGNDTQVLLFEPADAKATVTLSVETGGMPVGRERLHLGSRGTAPDSARVVIGAAARAVLSADRPPIPAQLKEWGIWVWLPSSAAEMTRPQALQAEELPEDLRDQLKSLGYLR
jgi:hypothetical protein